jgi:hypothetical protein
MGRSRVSYSYADLGFWPQLSAAVAAWATTRRSSELWSVVSCTLPFLIHKHCCASPYRWHIYCPHSFCLPASVLHCRTGGVRGGRNRRRFKWGDRTSRPSGWHSCFECRPGDRISWLRFFFVFLRPSGPVQYLRLGHNRFCIRSISLSINPPVIWCHIIWPTEQRH